MMRKKDPIIKPLSPLKICRLKVLRFCSSTIIIMPTKITFKISHKVFVLRLSKGLINIETSCIPTPVCIKLSHNGEF